LDRVNATQQESSAAVRRGRKPAGPTALHASIMGLHRRAGNRAVAGLLTSPTGAVQRDVGWKSDAVKEGHEWNVGEKGVGKIRRIPLEGLKQGLQQESATTAVWNDKKKEWESKTESTKNPGLSPESAVGRAIVLVPDGLDAKQKIEVVVFLHGYTENTGRPYAGWRTLSMPPPGKGKAPKKNEQLERLRQGVDKDDTAPVRDVALDQAEQQLEESGQAQQVIVLPQGGLHSQFGKAGDSNFDSGAYVAEIVARLQTEQAWKSNGKLAEAAPDIGRVSMAGHSGAGATLSKMARASVEAAKKKPAGEKGGKKEEEKPPATSTITGDLVIFDAINPTDSKDETGQLGAFEDWARMRLDVDLAALKAAKNDEEKLDYLRTAQKLRGYYSDSGYKSNYVKLDKAIRKWFDQHSKELGAFAPCLRANFVIKHIATGHEEMMRGSKAGRDRPTGSGGILDALQGLHPPEMKSTADCPPMPEPIA
jgi:hypothetical protein